MLTLGFGISKNSKKVADFCFTNGSKILNFVIQFSNCNCFETFNSNVLETKNENSMKKILFLLIIAIGTCKGQMVLENSYPNLISGQKFLLIQIEPSNFKYFIFDPNISQFKLYNINHSLYTTVNIPIAYSSTINNYNVCFVTKSLFDCDTTNLEYAIMNLGNGGPAFPTPSFSVYRSTGALLQKIDSCRFLNYGQGLVYGPYWNHSPIINTQAGAKLILSHVNGSVKVYGLCSVLPTNIAKDQLDAESNALPYPNPSSTKTILPYKMIGSEKGAIIIYNIQGQKIKELEVDHNFENIILENNELSSGTYFYTLKTSSSESKAKKFIVAK
jgi:hypothetical protein